MKSNLHLLNKLSEIVFLSVFCTMYQVVFYCLWWVTSATWAIGM